VKPNFLVIGAVKCATTSLCDILGSHPQIFVTQPKEPDFFCDDGVFARGWEWYESLYEDAIGKVAIGEGSTGYTKALLHPNSAERIASYLPDAKLIHIVRHPLKRIESHWLHLVAAGLDVTPFTEALKKWPHMIHTSLYWKQISRYRGFYPDKNLLVLLFEDLVKNPHAVLEKVYRFLDVTPELASADPARASHVSATFRLDTPLLRFLRRLPGMRTAKNLAPRISRNIIGAMRRPLPDRPQWPADLRERIIALVREYAGMFLRFYGKAVDYWQLN
jgi:hypothetical protein